MPLGGGSMYEAKWWAVCVACWEVLARATILFQVRFLFARFDDGFRVVCAFVDSGTPPGCLRANRRRVCAVRARAARLDDIHALAKPTTHTHTLASHDHN